MVSMSTFRRTKGNGIYVLGGEKEDIQRITWKGTLRKRDTVYHSLWHWFPKGGGRKQEANVDKESRAAGCAFFVICARNCDSSYWRNEYMFHKMIRLMQRSSSTLAVCVYVCVRRYQKKYHA